MSRRNRAPLRNSFRKLTKKFFVDTRRQKRSVAGLRFFLGKTSILDNAVAAEKFESRTKWGFLEVPNNTSPILSFVLLLFMGALVSCQDISPKELKKEVLFNLNFGKMEDQINLHGESSLSRYRKNRILMKNGFFYIGNGLSGKIMEFNSYGDILNLYYNKEMNPEPVLLGDSGDSDLAVTRNLYAYAFRDVGELAVGQNKKALRGRSDRRKPLGIR